MVFLGIISGQVSLPFVTSRLQSKVLVLGSLVTLITSLVFLIIISGSFTLLCLMRFLFGFSQILLISYFMAWIDVFSFTKFEKSL
jgi:hypothetical protein